MKTRNKLFAKRLKELREQKKLLQEELGKEFNLSKQMICYYENSNREPSLDLLVEFADFFKVSTDYLTGKSDYMTTTIEVLSKKLPYTQIELEKLIHLAEASNKKFNKIVCMDSFKNLIGTLIYYSQIGDNEIIQETNTSNNDLKHEEISFKEIYKTQVIKSLDSLIKEFDNKI